MKIINISVDIESQLLNSRSTSSQKNKPNENVSEQQKETKTPQKKARKTKGTQPEKLRPDTDRVSNET
jgi:hypothetical protein